MPFLGAQFSLFIQVRYRRVVQLVEQRSPKPQVAGSTPVSPANFEWEILK